jgi:hypothetical protein
VIKLSPSLTLSMQLLLALFAGAPLTAAALAVLGDLFHQKEIVAPKQHESARCYSQFSHIRSSKTPRIWNARCL